MLVKFSIDTKHMFEVLMYEYVYNMYKIVCVYICIHYMTIYLSLVQRERETSRESERARARGRERGREGGDGGREGEKEREGEGGGERKRGRGRGRKKERERKRERGSESESERKRGREGERRKKKCFSTLQPIHLHEQANMSLLPSCLSCLAERKKHKNTHCFGKPRCSQVPRTYRGSKLSGTAFTATPSSIEAIQKCYYNLLASLSSYNWAIAGKTVCFRLEWHTNRISPYRGVQPFKTTCGLRRFHQIPQSEDALLQAKWFLSRWVHRSNRWRYTCWFRLVYIP